MKPTTIKYIFFFFLATKTFHLFGQKNLDLNQLRHHWIKVENLNLNRNIKNEEDKEFKSSTVIHITDSIIKYGEMQGWCGNSGFVKTGKWSTNMHDTTLTFYFTELLDYSNSKGPNNLHETQIYKIIKLDSEELELRELFPEDKKTLLFKRKTNE